MYFKNCFIGYDWNQQAESSLCILNWTRPKLCVKKMNPPRSQGFLFRFPIFPQPLLLQSFTDVDTLGYYRNFQQAESSLCIRNWTRPKLCVKKMNLSRSQGFLFRFPIFPQPLLLQSFTDVDALGCTVSFWRALYLVISLRRCSFLRWYGVGRRDRQWWYW